MQKEVGELVKELRQEMPCKGVSQKTFGELLGVPASVVCDIENGNRPPSKAVAKKLAKLSGLPLEQFIR